MDIGENDDYGEYDDASLQFGVYPCKSKWDGCLIFHICFDHPFIN